MFYIWAFNSGCEWPMYNASFNLRHYGENMFEKRQVITVLIRKQQHGLHQECLSDMQVKIRFSDSIRKPGEATSLIITAEPGSQVAVTAVDKSVHLLKGGNELSQDDVRLLLLLLFFC